VSNETFDSQEPSESENQGSISKSSNRTQVTLSKSGLIKVGAFVLVVLLGVGGFFIFSSMKADARFTEALTLCEALDAPGIILAEDGQSLNFDGKGEDDFLGGDFSDLKCVLAELNAPSTVLDRMLRTNSLMGVQDAEWDGIAISWTYAPANGLDANFEIVK
jgi:hypothetical protein